MSDFDPMDFTDPENQPYDVVRHQRDQLHAALQLTCNMMRDHAGEKWAGVVDDVQRILDRIHAPRARAIPRTNAAPEERNE